MKAPANLAEKLATFAERFWPQNPMVFDFRHEGKGTLINRKRICSAAVRSLPPVTLSS
jgi:hypothetical protein